MATNLLVNVIRNALDNIPTPRSYGWTDSTVVLHWIKGNGQYKQFVANRLAKIQLRKEIQWRYVPTNENPADLASRGGPIKSSNLWESGPEWLQEEHSWPENPVLKSKVVREILSVAKTEPVTDEFYQLLERSSLRRTLRVGVWIKRFIHNCKDQTKRLGPITTQEMNEERNWWVRRIQEREREESPKIKAQLVLRPSAENLTTCHGRIQGDHPIYLPSNAKFTEKLVQRIHCETLHGGVGLTMAAVREQYWVPRLRSLVKLVRRKCHGCKRFRATAMTKPQSEQHSKSSARTLLGQSDTRRHRRKKGKHT